MVERKIVKFEKKDVFENFKDDDDHEVLATMLNNDNKVIRWAELCNNDERDMVATEQKVKAMFRDIKLIFRFLQNNSKRYPLVDKYAIEHFFVKPAELFTHSATKKYDIDIVILETLFNEKDPPATLRQAMNRS